MPMYQYVCPKCNKAFEIIIPLKLADKKITCKYCKKGLVKIMTAPYFSIK
jgi:putative FmdB family regulatory protein